MGMVKRGSSVRVACSSGPTQNCRRSRRSPRVHAEVGLPARLEGGLAELDALRRLRKGSRRTPLMRESRALRVRGGQGIEVFGVQRPGRRLDIERRPHPSPEFRRCDVHIGFAHPVLDREPVVAPVQVHAEPAAGTDVGGHEVVFRRHLRVKLLRPRRRRQPQCGMPVAVVVDGEQREDLPAHEVVGHALAAALLGFREREADRTDRAPDVLRLHDAAAPMSRSVSRPQAKSAR